MCKCGGVFDVRINVAWLKKPLEEAPSQVVPAVPPCPNPFRGTIAVCRYTIEFIRDVLKRTCAFLAKQKGKRRIT